MSTADDWAPSSTGRRLTSPSYVRLPAVRTGGSVVVPPPRMAHDEVVSDSWGT
ncbi:hypothetical protein [Streptomyces sp. NPDC002990]